MIKEYISDRVFDGTRPVTKEKAQKLNSKVIRRKVKSLNDKIAKAEKELEAFKKKCPHLTLTYKNEGSTGGWDRDDSYWRNWHCHDCGLHWTSQQTYESTRKYPHTLDITYMSYDLKEHLKKQGYNIT